MKSRFPNKIGLTRLSCMGLLVLMVPAACDGGTSREEFVAQANQICEDSETSLQELNGDALNREDPGEIIDVASEELSNLRDKLGDLDIPDNLSDDFESMIEGLDGAVEDTDSLSTAVDEAQKAGAEEAAAETLQEVQETARSLTTNLEQASDAARAMEIEGCGEATAGGS